MLSALKRKRINFLSFYLILGKLLGYTIFTVAGGNDVQTMDFKFQFDDFLLYVLHVSIHLFLLYFGVTTMEFEPYPQHIIISTGHLLALVMSLVTGIVSSSLVIYSRRKLLRILQLIHQIDSQVEIESQPFVPAENQYYIPLPFRLQMRPLGIRFNYTRELYVFTGIILTTCATVLSWICITTTQLHAEPISLISLLCVIVSNLNFTVLMSVAFTCLFALRSRLQTFAECFE